MNDHVTIARGARRGVEPSVPPHAPPHASSVVRREPRKRGLVSHLAVWLLVLALVAGAAAALGKLKYDEITAAIAAAEAMPEPQETVEAVTVRRGTWSASTRAVGTVVALRQVELRNELAGIVAEVGFVSGQVVEAGHVLVRLDSRQEEAALAAAEAEARLARLTYERREALSSGQTISAQAVDDAREEMAAAEARLRALAVVIEKMTIRAPFRARVGLTDLQPGAYLEAGTPVAALQGVDDDAYVDFSLPQESAATLRPGSEVRLSAAAIPGGGTTAQIVAEDSSVEAESRAVRFRALAPGLGHMLRPGSFVDVEATTAPPAEALFLPLTALRRASFGEHVYLLVEEDGVLRARQRIVRAGPISGDEIAVLEGLAEGDRVAGAGSFKLREGLKVAVSPAAAD